MMVLGLRSSALLLLASLLLLLQLAAAQSSPSACAESCRFVVPSLGPAGPAGPPGLNGTKGEKGEKGEPGDAAALDTNGLISGATTWNFPNTTDTGEKLVGEQTAQTLSNKTLTNTVGITFPALAAPSTSLTLNVYATATVTVGDTVWGWNAYSAGDFLLTFVRVGRLVTVSFPNCYGLMHTSKAPDAQGNIKIAFKTTGENPIVIPKLYRPHLYETVPHQMFTDVNNPSTYTLGYLSFTPFGEIGAARLITGGQWYQTSNEGKSAGFFSRSFSYVAAA